MQPLAHSNCRCDGNVYILSNYQLGGSWRIAVYGLVLGLMWACAGGEHVPGLYMATVASFLLGILWWQAHLPMFRQHISMLLVRLLHVPIERTVGRKECIDRLQRSPSR